MSAGTVYDRTVPASVRGNAKAGVPYKSDPAAATTRMAVTQGKRGLLAIIS